MPIQRTKNGEPYHDPGKRQARITFLEQALVADASGQAETWVEGAPPDVTSAEITSVRGLDVIKNGQDVSQVQIIATIAYKPPGRTATERFRDLRGNVYVIQAVRDLDPGSIKYQELVCLLIGTNVA